MAATATVYAQCAGIIRDFKDQAGFPVVLPALPSQVITTHTGNLWFSAQFIANATTASIDVAAGTTVGVASIAFGRGGAAAYASARYFLLTARVKAGGSAIVGNLIIAKVNTVEIGRIYVDATAQRGGLCLCVLPADQEDTRMAFGGTNDLTFTITTVDANLEIFVEGLGTD